MTIIKNYEFKITKARYFIYDGKVFIKSNTQTSKRIKLLKYNPEKLLENIRSNRIHWTID